MLDGESSSEIDPRSQAAAILSQGGGKPRWLYYPSCRGDIAMDKVITCPCGFVLRGSSDDEIVKKAQEHAKTTHGMELSRQQGLAMARPG